jgi:methionyl-tRNA formyltransferase
MTAKGVAVLSKIIYEFGADSIAFVVTAEDRKTDYDGFNDIKRISTDANISVYSRDELPSNVDSIVALAVSWRWLITENFSSTIIFHDSLLPKYRGFAPLVSALIKGEDRIGVTALLAREEYDSGPILTQEITELSYPVTIRQAIEKIIPCYEDLAVKVVNMVMAGNFQSVQQDESEATYSLWLDESDYQIDWNLDANQIRRFIDATGYPYKGAFTYISGSKVRVFTAEEEKDVEIENRIPGKVIFCQNGEPIIVCGSGLLKLKHAVFEDTQVDVLPLHKFRTRFGH